ncbi:CBASS cGAMP-activated phospholipase [Aquabacter sediminis]|uniref:CBASS cGAMP-activated phospholipase n=1 Tax=Aquabacter sediminis TaxID=3029197 RepID=UPI00237EDA6E|nr:CBASS cGAMP-activated phospholipase [Aquabacter sp. P-9]MDE1568250.1 CBASS cGAMP-activated phospholipase [Aquabacter sp. P-9]
MFTDRRVNSLGAKRRRQPWPKDKPFKILSLDGGGIKGIYTAEFLHRCQQTLGRGEPVVRYFDMIAGTSTGGIIALGLGLGLSTADIVTFYRDDGRKVFPPLPGRWWARAWQWVSWRFLGPKLAHEELEKALKHRFEDHLLGESMVRLVIPAFMMPKTEIAVFKTDHHEDFQNDHRTPMWKVARSTSAAPTYLKGHKHEDSGRIFIDGGVWANNPAMIALVDALTAYDLTPEQIEVFSIGTGNPPFNLSQPDVFGGLFAWKEIIKAAMFLTTDNATAQTKLLLGPDRCLRVEPAGEDALVEMDDYGAAFARLPALAERDFNANKEAISRFFTATVEPRERHYT